MPDTLRLRKLFDGVSQHIDIGKYNDFINKIQIPEKRKLFYDNASQYIDIGDFNTFENKISESFKINTLEDAIERARKIRDEKPIIPPLTIEKFGQVESPYQQKIKTAGIELPGVPIKEVPSPKGMLYEAARGGRTAIVPGRKELMQFIEKPLAQGILKYIPPNQSDENLDRIFSGTMFRLLPKSYQKAIYGGLRGIVESGVSFTSPEMIAIIAGTGGLPGIAQKMIATLFTVQMAKMLPEETKNVYNAIKSGNPEEITNKLVHLGITGAFTVGMGKQVLRGEKPTLIEKPEGVKFEPITEIEKKAEFPTSIEEITADIQIIKDAEAHKKAVETRGSIVFVKIPESDFPELQKGIYGKVIKPGSIEGLKPALIEHQLEKRTVQRLYNPTKITSTQKEFIPEFPKAGIVEKPEIIEKQYKMLELLTEAYRFNKISYKDYSRMFDDVKKGYITTEEQVRRNLEEIIKTPEITKEVPKIEIPVEKETTKLGLILGSTEKPLYKVTKKEIREHSDKIASEELEKGIIDEKEWRVKFYEDYFLKNHKKDIQQAISEGKTIPDKVLADYPELKAKPKITKAPEIKENINKFINEYRSDIEAIKKDVEAGRPGERRPFTAGLTQVEAERLSPEEIQKWVGEPTTYPPYMQNKGLTGKGVLNITDKALTGKGITQGEFATLKDLVKSREDLQRRVAETEEMRREKLESEKETINVLNIEKGDEFTINNEKYKATKEEAGKLIIVDSKEYVLDMGEQESIEIDKGSLVKGKEKPTKVEVKIPKEIKEFEEYDSIIKAVENFPNADKDLISTVISTDAYNLIKKYYPNPESFWKQVIREKPSEVELKAEVKKKPEIFVIKPETRTIKELETQKKEYDIMFKEKRLSIGDYNQAIKVINRNIENIKEKEIKRPPTEAELKIPEEKKPYPTTSMFVTKDVKTGEKILANEPVWFYPELGGMVKEKTHKKLFQQIQDTGKLFYESELEKTKIRERAKEQQELFKEKEKKKENEIIDFHSGLSAIVPDFIQKRIDGIEKIFKGSQTKISKISWNLVKDYYGKRYGLTFKYSDKWDKLFKNKFSKNELEDAIFYRQRTGNIWKKDDIFENLSIRLPEKLKGFIDGEVNEHINNWREIWNASPFTKDIEAREEVIKTYLTGVYSGNIKRGYEYIVGLKGRSFVTRNFMLNKKVYLNFEEAFRKAGFVPRFRNIIDQLNYQDAHLIRLLSNNELIGKIRNLEKEIKSKLIIRSNSKLYDEAKLLKDEDGKILYIPFVDPYLRSYPVGKTEKGKIIWTTSKAPALVYRDLADAIQSIFSKDAYKPDNIFWRNYDRAGSLLRYIRVTFSGFHLIALTESLVGGKGTGVLNIFKWIKRGNRMLNDPEIMIEAKSSILRFKAPSETARREVEGGIRNLANVLEAQPGVKKYLGKTIKGIASIPFGITHFIFEKYLPLLKVQMYYDYKQKTLKILEKKNISIVDAGGIKEINRKVASYVNDQFGGQAWEMIRYLNDPKIMKWMHRLVGYPDWSISALRQAGGLLESGIRGSVARHYWLRYGIAFIAVQEAMSYICTGFYNDKEGKVKWSWKNAHSTFENIDPSLKHKIDFQLPDIEIDIPLIGKFNPGRELKDDGTYGRRYYSHFGKQMLEIPRYALNFNEQMFAKSNPVIQIVAKQIFGGAPYEGGIFPARGEYVGIEYQPWKGKKGIGRLQERAIQIIEDATPFSIQSMWTTSPATAGLIPVSKATSLYASQKYIENALKNKDGKQLRNIVESLLDSGYSRDSINRIITTVGNRIGEEKISYIVKKSENKILSIEEYNELDRKLLELLQNNIYNVEKIIQTNKKILLNQKYLTDKEDLKKQLESKKQ